ncbi:uncharacterized protein LOC143868532 [Tasmannia lanceolata]|uniref:uncharacterized protein LOC143868532 n=1 Tax=Tasmannia lanceolata TaxID=3420 RepID=UPI004063A109
MVSATKKTVDTRRFYHNTGQLFADQYYHIYNARLLESRESLIRNSRFRWGDEVKNVPLEQLNSSLGSTDVFVIGTLFKLMPKQPSILRELEENEAVVTDPNHNFTKDEDTLILHETDENVRVVGDIDVSMHVTGIPVSLLGNQLDGGAKFHVKDVCYAGLNLSVYKEPKKTEKVGGKSQDERLLIISGLEFGFDFITSKDRTNEIVAALKKLRNFVTGTSTKEEVNGFNGTKISRIIIAGNSIASGYAKAKSEYLGSSESKDTRSLTEVFELFDKYLFTLAQSGAIIDLMPGKNDPTSFLLPQQPLHPKILPKSGVLENIHPTTNPALIEHNDLLFLGTSGENVLAIKQYSKIEHSTTILRSTLEWGHIAPSAPDNLSCVPFKGKDPFIIDFAPDVYFAGNQPEFLIDTYSTEDKSKIQIVSVPSFVNTLTCVLVDPSNLEVEPICFAEK